MTAIENPLAQSLGIICGGAGLSYLIFNLNAVSNNNQIGYSFVAQSAAKLSGCRVYNTSSLQGTGGTINCLLQSDGNGAPSGTTIDTLTVGALAGNSMITASQAGGTTLTRGTKYWVVWSNTDASPATNYIAPGYLNNITGNVFAADDNSISTNAGSTWAQKNCGGGMRFDFSDGTYLGMPLTGAPALIGTQAVYSTNEVGTQFTTPANGNLVVRGLAMAWAKTGVPTGNPYMRLYDASHNLLGSTFQVSNADALANVNQWYHRNFDPSTVSGGADTITLSPSTQYTITLAESTNSDTSAKIWRPFSYQFDTDTNSLPLIPWSAQADIFNGGSWSQTMGLVPCFQLLLQSGGEFASTGGSGGMLYMPGLSGGVSE